MVAAAQAQLGRSGQRCSGLETGGGGGLAAGRGWGLGVWPSGSLGVAAGGVSAWGAAALGESLGPGVLGVAAGVGGRDGNSGREGK